MDIDNINDEIELIKNTIEPLRDKMTKLISIKKELESKNFIKENQITVEQVERCDGINKPYFEHIKEFESWLLENSKKKWVEWNGMLYLRSEIIAGKINPNAKGRYEDLKNT